MKKYIFVTFQKEGIHAYPDAATNPKLATGKWDDVSFLSHPHRHVFWFKLSIEIFHNDRCLEFVQIKRQCLKWFDKGTLKLDSKSCEMISDELYELVSDRWPGRDVIIEISEDNENGCIIEYFK